MEFVGSEKLIKALIIEDNGLVREKIRALLSPHQVYEIESLALFPDSLKIAPEALDLVLLDLKSSHDPDATKTLCRLPEFRRQFPRAEIWVQSGSEDVTLMRECIRSGAHRFLLKEHLVAELPLILEALEARQERRAQIGALIQGQSSVVERLREELLSLSYTEVDVLIEGESGSGKELCAQAFSKNLVAVNVAALPADLFEAEIFGYEKGAFSGAHAAKEGFFEVAKGGALFLDEIQSLRPELQAKLLRVLETRKFRRLGSTRERDFDARLICAANVSLSEKVQRGEFREDLYYRIAPVTVKVPPLRLRVEDISGLADLFLKEFDPRGTRKWGDGAMEFLRGYEWPGNVRELRGMIRAICARLPYPVIGGSELQAQLPSWSASAPKSLREPEPSLSGDNNFVVNWSQGLDANIGRLEAHMLEKTLARMSSSEARERLGVKRSRFYEKLKQYGLLKETEDQSPE